MQREEIIENQSENEAVIINNPYQYCFIYLQEQLLQHIVMNG